MRDTITTDILEKWLRAWTLSRVLSPPIKYRSGYKVDVGYEHHKTRYVFPKVNEDFIQLAKEIKESGIFLKACASPEEIINVIPAHWTLQPQGYMMSCDSPMNIPQVNLPEGYIIDFESYNSTVHVKVYSNKGDLAASGRIVLVEDLAVFDRIITEESHRRKGLATIVISKLEQIAMAKGVYSNLLVATESGRLLYQSLGWHICSLYTSVVIAK